MTGLEALASFVAGCRSADFPTEVIEAASLHFTDAVGAWFAATRTAEAKPIAVLRRRFDTEGIDGVLADVAARTALARLSEIDDIHLASGTTPGGIIVPAALTLAASPEAEGGTLTEAIVAGYEAMVRLGRAINGPEVLYRGIWPTYFGAPFAVAAVTARLMKLSPEQTAHAMALALTLAAPGVGHHASPMTSRWFAVGHAARNGVTAALAARDGFVSDPAIFDGPFLRRIYSIEPRPAELTESLGERFAIAETSIKPWCAARQTIAASQALREMIAEGLNPETVTFVVVGVPPPQRAMVDHGVAAGERTSHLTSIPYQLALAVFDPDAAFDVRQSPPALPDDVAGLMRLVRVEAAEDLLVHYPQAWPARVTVHAADGAQTRVVLNVPGDPARPFDRQKLRDKFLKATAGLVETQAADSIFSASLDAFERKMPRMLLDAIAHASGTAA